MFLGRENKAVTWDHVIFFIYKFTNKKVAIILVSTFANINYQIFCHTNLPIFIFVWMHECTMFLFGMQKKGVRFKFLVHVVWNIYVMGLIEIVLEYKRF